MVAKRSDASPGRYAASKSATTQATIAKPTAPRSAQPIGRRFHRFVAVIGHSSGDQASTTKMINAIAEIAAAITKYGCPANVSRYCRLQECSERSNRSQRH